MESRAHKDPRLRDPLSRESTAFYREIFEHSPVPVRVEDWSKVKTTIDGLVRRGVKNWRRYLDRRPEQVIHVINLIDVIDVSAATLKIYDAERKEDVVALTWVENMSAARIEAFRAQLIAFAEGESRFDRETEERTMSGEAWPRRSLSAGKSSQMPLG